MPNAVAVALLVALIFGAPGVASAQDAEAPNPPAAIAAPPAPTSAIRTFMPAVPVTIKYLPCPDIPMAGGCYYADTDTMYVRQGPDFNVQHEMGHAVDDQRMDPGERHAFSCLAAMLPYRPLKPRCGAPWAPRLAEMFADAYANCALGARPSDQIAFVDGNGYLPTTDRRHSNACRFISRAMR